MKLTKFKQSLFKWLYRLTHQRRWVLAYIDELNIDIKEQIELARKEVYND